MNYFRVAAGSEEIAVVFEEFFEARPGDVGQLDLGLARGSACLAAFHEKPVSGLRFCDIGTVEFLDLIAGIDEFAVGLEFFAGCVLAAADVGCVEAGY